MANNLSVDMFDDDDDGVNRSLTKRNRSVFDGGISKKIKFFYKKKMKIR